MPCNTTEKKDLALKDVQFFLPVSFSQAYHEKLFKLLLLSDDWLDIHRR